MDKTFSKATIFRFKLIFSACLIHVKIRVLAFILDDTFLTCWQFSAVLNEIFQKFPVLFVFWVFFLPSF